MSLHKAKSDQQQQRVAARQKLIILLVGLPARGKTYLANKIMCYMNWWYLVLRFALQCQGTPSNSNFFVEAGQSALQFRSDNFLWLRYSAQDLFCRLGHETRHFNIGQYRRAQSHGRHESHTAQFFDSSNPVKFLPLSSSFASIPSDTARHQLCRALLPELYKLQTFMLILVPISGG